MLFPERTRSALWQRLFLQATVAATLACALFTGTEVISANLAARDVAQQQQWNRERNQAQLKRLQDAADMQPAAYTSNGVRIFELPEVLADYPDVPLDTLRGKVSAHEQKARSYGWLGGLAFFITGSTATAAGATRRRSRLQTARAQTDRIATAPPFGGGGYSATGKRALQIFETADTAGLKETGGATAARILGMLGIASGKPTRELHVPVSGLSPVPASGEISAEEMAATTRRFEPTVYCSSDYGTEMGTLDGMFNNPQLTFTERTVHRVRTALAVRRERIHEQQEIAATSYSPYATYHNAIEPIIFDTPAA